MPRMPSKRPGRSATSPISQHRGGAADLGCPTRCHAASGAVDASVRLIAAGPIGAVRIDIEVADHQVIFRAGQVEAVVVPLEEYRALKALERREAELYWVAHQDGHPSAPGDDVPDGNVYDSMEALVADLGTGE
jgi:hypothetical protein